MVEVRGEGVFRAPPSLLGKNAALSGKSDGHVRPHRPSNEPQLHCPECGSDFIAKDGKRYLFDATPIQRFLCKKCGYRFSEKGPQGSAQPLQKASDTSQHVERIDTQSLKGKLDIIYNRRVGVSEREAKNLAKVGNPIRTELAGATRETVDLRGKIIEFAWWLQKEGRKPSTITVYSWHLKFLLKNNINLLDPEAVKGFIGKQDWAESRKYSCCQVYNTFLDMLGIKWRVPSYKLKHKFPFLPTEQELDRFIASAGKKLAAALETAKETAMRVGEIARIKWTDIDFEKSIIFCNEPEKNSEPRVFKASAKLIAMVNALPRKNEYVFGPRAQSLDCLLFAERKCMMRKLQEPRLAKIGFHTFRHWKATALYHETHNPLLVKEYLGHRSMDSTLLYIQLEKTLYKEQSDTFNVMAIRDQEEIKSLLETGFDYVCQKDDLVFLRKRK
jgi:integrase/ribosomal protein S27AE